jgi:ethanolamine ammonia-lyase small subunit
MHPPEESAPAVSVPPAAPSAAADPWVDLRRFTAARIALGRSGGSQRTASVLDFRLAHARARDAVHAPFDADALRASFAASGLQTRALRSEAPDRRTYLLRPDLGRRLSLASRAQVEAWKRDQIHAPDLVIIVSDGLAAAAAERHALDTLVPLAAALRAAGWRLAPVFVVPQARVKLQDEIGALLGARYSLILLGERPGLGTPDSLGAYFTKNPAPERTDADRNCLSNIRAEGLPPPQAAAKLATLLLTSARTGLAGIHLKDMEPATNLAKPPVAVAPA